MAAFVCSETSLTALSLPKSSRSWSLSYGSGNIILVFFKFKRLVVLLYRVTA